MPCYRCGTRQVDPGQGQSPWKRGVRGDSQVLICPGCQSGRDWAADLDRCTHCGTVHLVRRLGEVECKDCGKIHDPAAQQDQGPGDPVSGDLAPGNGDLASGDPAPAIPPPGKSPGDGRPDPGHAPAAPLADEVAKALDRMLGPSRLPR